MKPKIILSILFIICVTIGCAKVSERKPIKISINVWPGYAYAFIAQEKGFFVKNGVDVELVLKQNNAESVQLYKNGEVDGFFDVFTDVIIINSEGIPTKVVYVTDYSISTDVIIARPEIQSASDLKGKTVSFEDINTFSHLFVLKVLDKAGIEETDVFFKIVSPMDVLNAMEKRHIDAGHTWEPITSRALQKGCKIIARAGDIPGVITDVLAFHAHLIQERPDDIQRIVKSLLEARNFLDSNRAEALEIMARTEGITREETESGIRGVYLLNLNENINTMKDSKEAASLYRSFDTITEFYFRSGQLSEKPDFETVIEPKFVEAVEDK